MVLTETTSTLYYVQCAVELGNHNAYLLKESTMQLWYQRLGYLNLTIINSMWTWQLVNGLEIKLPQKYNHLYSGCANGKSHWLLLSEASFSQYSKMQLVVMDLTSPMLVVIWNSNLYILVVIEVSYHYPVGQLLKDKEEAWVTVWDVISMLKCQSRSKVWCLCSDNSSKFANAAIDQFCHHNGIIHEMTNPYIPEQNGIAKWAIIIFFEIVCCMLYSAEVDLRY